MTDVVQGSTHDASSTTGKAWTVAGTDERAALAEADKIADDVARTRLRNYRRDIAESRG
jgi:hypothetical protein